MCTFTVQTVVCGNVGNMSVPLNINITESLNLMTHHVTHSNKGTVDVVYLLYNIFINVNDRL